MKLRRGHAARRGRQEASHHVAGLPVPRERAPASGSAETRATRSSAALAIRPPATGPRTSRAQPSATARTRGRPAACAEHATISAGPGSPSALASRGGRPPDRPDRRPAQRAGRSHRPEAVPIEPGTDRLTTLEGGPDARHDRAHQARRQLLEPVHRLAVVAGGAAARRAPRLRLAVDVGPPVPHRRLVAGTHPRGVHGHVARLAATDRARHASG